MPCGGSAPDGKIWKDFGPSLDDRGGGGSSLCSRFEISLRCLNSARLNLCFSASEICFVRLHNSGAVAVGGVTVQAGNSQSRSRNRKLVAA